MRYTSAERDHEREAFFVSRFALVYRVSLTAPLIRLFCRLQYAYEDIMFLRYNRKLFSIKKKPFFVLLQASNFGPALRNAIKYSTWIWFGSYIYSCTIYLSNRLFFSAFTWPLPYTMGRGRGRSLGEFETVIQTRDAVESLDNFREFSQPPECLDEAM